LFLLILQALDQVREKMAASPYSEQITEEQMRWFLLDRKFDVEATVDKLIKMLRWRREFGYGFFFYIFIAAVLAFPLQPTPINTNEFLLFYSADELKTTDVAKEAATGKAFLHTALDVQNRPVIIVRACKHVNGASPLLESQKLCVHTLDRAMERLPETGQETILGIFDLRGFTSKNADLGFIRFMVDVFFTFYPKRLSQVLFVDAPWIFMASWNVFKTWLSKYQALVRFVSAEQVRKEYFTSETVPEDFANEGFPRKK
jgi:hypothetical protein